VSFFRELTVRKSGDRRDVHVFFDARNRGTSRLSPDSLSPDSYGKTS